MNYVPVDTGIISTNLSGTKDAASQEVKKDVSSLRYIALPNWAHDALLEFSSSKPQDHCSTEVPKGSGKPNLAASTSNPPADQMVTLTVETPIPTVSSLVPTAYSTDSQDPLSDARLISKRVANQVETPPLDNILSLTNRFKDILGVTTNSDESNGVEADISNMETAITASPTPTLRIHKDHPKSQIIGHVDTPIQTKNKFKEDPEFPAKVYKVEKSMYGLYQAPRAWYGTLSKYLLKNGFQRGDILKKFGYSDIRSSNTPMDKENPWGKDGTGKDVDLHLYRSMIRSLMYLTASRPDIMFVVCACARHQVIGTSKYWGVLRIFMISLRLIPLTEHNANFHPMVDFIEASPIRRTRIAQSYVLPTVADKPASPLRDVSQGEAFPTDSGFIADQDRATIDKSSTLPYDLAPRVTSPVVDEGKINRLKERVKMLEDRKGVAATRSRDDPLIKGRSMDEGEAATERISDDSDEMVTVLTSMDAATVLASGVVDVSTGSRSIPTACTPAEEQVPTGSDVVPTASPVFATATVVTPYRRRKGKEVMVKSETLKKQKVQEQIDAHVTRELEEQLERGLEKEYHQFALELPFERRIELITDLMKYQDNYAKIYKFQSQQRKPWTKKQKRDYYMAVIRSNLGWKVKDFRGMSFEEVEAKFNLVWKQMDDFIPMGSKEEAERIKRKGLNLEQESAKKQKTSEEVLKEAMSPEEVPKEKEKEMMQLVFHERHRSYRKITRLGGSSASYQFFIDLLKHLDREDLNQLWRLVKETLSNRPPTSDKEIELWVELSRLYEPDHKDQLWTHTQNFMHALIEWKLYDTCGVHHVTSKDKEIFMLVEKDYPLRKGLALVMISYKLQVENYSQMFDIESDLREIEFLLYQGKGSGLKDSLNQTDLANFDNYFVDPTPEMFTNEHAPDYSFLLRFDVYPHDFLEIKSDADNFYDDPFDSKGEKIKDSELLIDELDLPCVFLPYSEYDSFASQDFSRDDDFPSPDNEDKVFNPGILIHEKSVKIITRVTQEKKLEISYASLVLEDFDPPFLEPLVFKDVPKSMRLLPFSSKNEEKIFKPGIYTSEKVHSCFLPELSHPGYHVFKVKHIFISLMRIFHVQSRKNTPLLDVLLFHFYPP
nr:hypothetical protein [Tanacetum cinerariifolium]